MPVSFWVASETFVWPAPPKPRPKPKKPRAACPRAKSGQRLSPQCRTVLIDRLEAGVEAGRIRLIAEDMGEPDGLDFTLAEYALLLRLLFPEEYLAPAPKRVRAPAPTGTAPGSAARIAAYAERAGRGQALYAAGDATAHKAHDRGLKIAQRRNGSGVQVVGWDDGG